MAEYRSDFRDRRGEAKFTREAVKFLGIARFYAVLFCPNSRILGKMLYSQTSFGEINWAPRTISGVECESANYVRVMLYLEHILHEKSRTKYALN